MGVGLRKVFESGNGSAAVLLDDATKPANETDTEDERGGKQP